MAQIRTTHTGSLHRPDQLRIALVDQEQGEQVPALESLTHQAVLEVVHDQAKAGIDLVNDGEMGRPGYATYVKYRLTGFESQEISVKRNRDIEAFPDYAEMLERTRPKYPGHPVCSGPVVFKGLADVRRDIANLKEAASLASVPEDQLFLTAASPGVIALFYENRYYPSRDEYASALIDAMRQEYAEIVNAGIMLQIDCPDFATRWNDGNFQGLSVDEFRDEVSFAVDALNAATSDLPADRMRAHVCWGNTPSPHTCDIPLQDIVDIVLRARPAGLVLEACNPRHGHEWQLFESVKLPDEKYLVPGVIDTTTNFVEHPELVAQRILNYVQLVGVDRVIAGTDCGFGSVAVRDFVVRSVAWEKLRSLVAGAQLAGNRC